MNDSKITDKLIMTASKITRNSVEHITSTETKINFGTEHVYLTDEQMKTYWKQLTGKKTVDENDLFWLDALVDYVRQTAPSDRDNWIEFWKENGLFGYSKEVK